MARLFKVCIQGNSVEVPEEVIAIKPVFVGFSAFKDEVIIRKPELVAKNLRFSYEDAEGDRITLLNDTDFEWFFKTGINKVYVTIDETDDLTKSTETLKKTIWKSNVTTQAHPSTLIGDRKKRDLIGMNKIETPLPYVHSALAYPIEYYQNPSKMIYSTRPRFNDVSIRNPLNTYGASCDYTPILPNAMYNVLDARNPFMESERVLSALKTLREVMKIDLETKEQQKMVKNMHSTESLKDRLYNEALAKALLDFESISDEWLTHVYKTIELNDVFKKNQLRKQHEMFKHPLRNEHSNKHIGTDERRIYGAVNTMLAMGYRNEDWLVQLLRSVDGDVTRALELMQPCK